MDGAAEALARQQSAEDAALAGAGAPTEGAPVEARVFIHVFITLFCFFVLFYRPLHANLHQSATDCAPSSN